jgi:hypothetical protein
MGGRFFNFERLCGGLRIDREHCALIGDLFEGQRHLVAAAQQRELPVQPVFQYPGGKHLRRIPVADALVALRNLTRSLPGR